MTNKNVDELITVAEKELSHLEYQIMDKRTDTIKWIRHHLDIIKSIDNLYGKDRYSTLIKEVLMTLSKEYLHFWLLAAWYDKKEMQVLRELEDEVVEIQDKILMIGGCL